MGQAHPSGIVGGPFYGAVLLMEGDMGTQVWVDAGRTRVSILFNDGAVASGLLVLTKPQVMEIANAQGQAKQGRENGEGEADAESEAQHGTRDEDAPA